MSLFLSYRRQEARIRQVLQNRFVRIPGRDSDMHAVVRKQPGATRTVTGATANDEGHILYGCVSVGLGHVLCFHRRLGKGAIPGFVQDESSHEDLYSNLVASRVVARTQVSGDEVPGCFGKRVGNLKVQAMPGIRHTAARASACPHGRQTFPEIPGPPPRSLSRSDLSLRATYR